MAEQAVDVTQLRGLVEDLASMVEYAEALRAGASAFAYMLPAEWQGPAFSRFLMSFETWAASAQALTEDTSLLQAQAQAVLAAYEAGIEQCDTSWAGFRGQLGA